MGIQTGSLIVTGSTQVIVPFAARPSFAQVFFEGDAPSREGCGPQPEADRLKYSIVRLQDDQTCRYGLKIQWELHGSTRKIKWLAAWL